MKQLIPGITVTMGGVDWVVPALTLGQLRRMLPQVRQLSDIGTTMDEPQIAVLVEIVTAALKRNYAITRDEVEELLDLGNAAQVLHAVLTGSGLRAAAPGEALAVATISDRSMPPSPPPAATAIP
jgi:hypothetical protein